MTETYPIVEQRSLDPAQRRRVLLWRKEYREPDELPKASAHEMLVYRVDGEYVLDSAQRKADEDQVINATSVSVVDMTRDAEVIVQLGIPSAEASEFTMRVTFVCTVTNAVLVVREGLRDAEAILRAYLKSHNRIFELGLEYRETQINEVRRKVNAQVTAFTTMKPPVIPGLVVELRSVEVLTPDEFRKFLDSRRAMEYKHELDAAEQTFDHDLTVKRQYQDQRLETGRVDHEHVLAAKQQHHDQKLDWERAGFVRSVARETQTHDLNLKAQRADYQRIQRARDRDELVGLAELIGSNPQSALTHAFLAGELSASDLADRLLAEERHKWELEREDRLARLEREHQEKLLEIEQRGEARRWSRARDRERDRWAREDVGFAREDEQRAREISLEVIREVAKRGHFDLSTLDAQRLINDVLAGAGPRPEIPAQDKPELTAADPVTPGEPAEEADHDDTAVREEDVS